MSSELFVQANRIWKNLAPGKTQQDLKFEVDAYRRMLNYFMVGEYYYYIFNVKDVVFELLSDEIMQVLGHSPERMNVHAFISLIHPEDQPYFLAYENRATEFIKTVPTDQVVNYKISYDYRMRKADGSYLRILHQTVAITHDENNSVLRTFGVHTDISHLKTSGAPVLSFIGLNGAESFLNIQMEDEVKSRSAGLTQREYEILKLLVVGTSSEQIGRQLFISKQTVDVHRKNVLEKTACKNTVDLTRHAVSRGWV